MITPLPKVIIITAPSGAGKTTLVRYLLDKMNHQLAFSVSATTRARREHEIEGKDYYFISKEEFIEKRDKGEFLEWEEVYDGNYYGTLKSEVLRIAAQHKSCIFDVDVKGALNIKKHYGSQALAIFIKVPSIADLRRRLEARLTETPQTIERRLQRAVMEIQHENDFDRIIVNRHLPAAKRTAYHYVSAFLNETPTTEHKKQQKATF
ncbi:MAG: guanylate kinase [Sphingobacteriales bacterium]|nr:guanylate kinase [Sphingobacteriales bacterium]